jgi:hypothetical protein
MKYTNETYLVGRRAYNTLAKARTRKTCQQSGQPGEVTVEILKVTEVEVIPYERKVKTDDKE